MYVGVFLDETDEFEDGLEERALGMVQNECRLDCWPLDWLLGGRLETGS